MLITFVTLCIIYVLHLYVNLFNKFIFVSPIFLFYLNVVLRTDTENITIEWRKKFSSFERKRWSNVRPCAHVPVSEFEWYRARNSNLFSTIRGEQIAVSTLIRPSRSDDLGQCWYWNSWEGSKTVESVARIPTRPDSLTARASLPMNMSHDKHLLLETCVERNVCIRVASPTLFPLLELLRLWDTAGCSTPVKYRSRSRAKTGCRN